MQFEDTINKWHTCKATAPINSSNPCSEYVFIDDSACNLASINLMKFRREDGSFDGQRFKAAVKIFLLAQEILVDNVSYPTQAICENSHRFRPLGLGYANLGCLLMSMGLPYDSEEGRDMASAITALMHGAAYVESATTACRMGPFEGFALNRTSMLQVLELHRQYGDRGAKTACTRAAKEVWDLATSELNDAVQLGYQYGYRNAQVTLLAPTGTIAFLMDCDTTGVEPDIALVKYKKLAGGGVLKIVNRTVPLALQTLGYNEEETKAIVDHIDAHDTIEGSLIRPEHRPVFDCAFPPPNGGRSIRWEGHVLMLAAVTPFLSGAISKTINLPNDCTVHDIRKAYYLCWELGIKAAAVYRDGSKSSQPLNTKRDEEPAVLRAERERLPDERQALTHKFDIQGHEGYLTVGLYPDGRMGEMFVTMSKEGSTVGGLMDAIATAISIGLQHGVPLETFVEKFAHSRFEPAGFTKNPDIPIAKSITDYIFRWLGIKFLAGYRETVVPPQEAPPPPTKALVPIKVSYHQADAPACPNCGSITVRNGTCYRCHSCGESLGCS
jgi:ribonucleoside-diphosphate reductase alpha chain